MKRLLVALSVVIFVSHAHGSGLAASVGVGLNSDKGVFGFGIEVPMLDGYTQFDVGADPAGLLLGAMYKVPVYTEKSGEAWYTKCLFLFECDASILLGIGVKHFSAYTAKARAGAADETEYEVGQKWGAGATLTLRDEFRSRIIWDVDISFRQVFRDADVTLSRGVEQVSDRGDLRRWDSGLGVGTSLGYRF